jgi:hypothetical protein
MDIKHAKAQAPIKSRGTGLVACLACLALLMPLMGSRPMSAAPDAPQDVTVDLPGGYVYESSPVLADVNGDGKQEIFVGGYESNCAGHLWMVKSDGSIGWSVSTRAPIDSSPAVADIDGDGVPEVVVGLGTFASQACAHGGLQAFNARTGAVKWTFDTQDRLNNGFRDPVYSTPAIADFFGDGRKQIVFGSWDFCIYMVDGAGNPVWGQLNDLPRQTHCGAHGFYNEDSIWSSPAVADLNGDGLQEIIIGADITHGNQNGDGDGGYLYVLDRNGTQLARQWFDQVIYSSPAVGDIDKDGKKEIVVGTGPYWAGQGHYVSVWNYDATQSTVTTRLVQKWGNLATNGGVFASPALGDIDGDGYADIVVTAYIGDNTPTGNQVYAWSGRDGTQLWMNPVCDHFNYCAYVGRSSPIIANIDPAAGSETLFGYREEVRVLDQNGNTLKYFYNSFEVPSAAAVGDLNNDGKLEVVFAGRQWNADGTFAGKLAIVNTTASSSPAPAWPMFRQNARRTGALPLPGMLSVSPASLYVLHEYGDPSQEQATLLINNTGDVAVDWNATPPGPNVTLSPSSGSLTGQAAVAVTIAASGYSTGTYSLGNITVSGTSGGVSVGSVNVPVTLYVGQVYKVYLPVAIK